MADAIDPGRQYGVGDLPADVFNVTSGDTRNFQGQDVKVTVNNNNTRTLTPLGGPGNSGDVQGYLNDYHSLVSNLAKEYAQPMQSDAEIMNEVKSNLLPNTPIPQAPNMVATFESLRSDPKVSNLESKLAALKDQENAIKAQTQTSQAVEDGKPVATNVIQGRQTEEQRLADIQLSSLADQKAAVTDELNMRYTMIDNIMKYTQADYDNATKSYEEQFAQNQAVFTAFNSIKTEEINQKQQQESNLITATGKEVDIAQQQEQFRYQQQQDIIKNASSNLTIMANMIQSGNVNYASMTADQKLNIQKLEVQAGMPAGFIENLTSTNANGKVVYAGANGVIMQMPDGSLQSQSVSLKSGSGSGSSTVKSDTAQFNLDKKLAPGYLAEDAANSQNTNGKFTLSSLLKTYSPYMSPEAIVKTYQANSPVALKETPQQLQKLLTPYKTPTQPKQSTALNF